MTEKCYDCGTQPTIATDTKTHQQYCRECAQYHELVGDILDFDPGTGLTTRNPRPLHTIAVEIRKCWPTIGFAPVTYLEMMESLDSISDRYFEDPAGSIIHYFLENAWKWRGPDARRIKAELRAMMAV